MFVWITPRVKQLNCVVFYPGSRMPKIVNTQDTMLASAGIANWQQRLLQVMRY
jgi:hypothetical protein